MSLFNERTANFGEIFTFPDNSDGVFIAPVRQFSRGRSLVISGNAKSGLFEDSFKRESHSFFFTPDHAGEVAFDKLACMDPQSHLPENIDLEKDNWTLKCMDDDIAIRLDEGKIEGTWTIPVKNVDIEMMEIGTELIVHFSIGYYFNPAKKQYGPYLKAKRIEGVVIKPKTKKK